MNHVNLQDFPGRGHAGGMSKGPSKDFPNRSEAMLLDYTTQSFRSYDQN